MPLPHHKLGWVTSLRELIDGLIGVLWQASANDWSPTASILAVIPRHSCTVLVEQGSEASACARSRIMIDSSLGAMARRILCTLST